jgi:lambda family phage portal protein
MAPIITTARDMSDFIDAANVKARVEACFSAFITNDDSTAGLFDAATDSTMQIGDYSNPGASVTTLEPGMMKELRAGQDIKFASPTSTSQIEPIMMYNLQAMAAGVGCTYDQMSGDLRQANYSSLRAGKLDFWRLVAQLQNHTVIPKFCKPTWDRFVSRAVLAGAIKLPKGTRTIPVDWIVPAKEYIDPKKDADAEKNEVRSGRVTPQAYIASRGGNYRKTLADFKTFFDDAHAMDVTLDIDVARVDQHGRQPPKAGLDATDPADTEDKTIDDTADDAADDGSDDGNDRVLRIPLIRKG